MSASSPTARERELAAKIHDATGIAEDLRAYRESILLEFEALAEDIGEPLAPAIYGSLAEANAYTAGRNAALNRCWKELRGLIAKLREEP